MEGGRGGATVEGGGGGATVEGEICRQGQRHPYGSSARAHAKHAKLKYPPSPQVMPQLLNHLGADASDPCAPDWGAIAVYTCAASCAPDPPAAPCADDLAAAAAAGSGERATSVAAAAALERLALGSGRGGPGGGGEAAEAGSTYLEEWCFVQPSA